MELQIILVSGQNKYKKKSTLYFLASAGALYVMMLHYWSSTQKTDGKGDLMAGSSLSFLTEQLKRCDLPPLENTQGELPEIYDL